jgi:hypothetical protein
MSDTNIYTGDAGTKIRLNTFQDLEKASIFYIKYTRPDNSTGEWRDCNIELKSCISYITKKNDLNMPGIWKLQVYIELPDWSGHGAIDNMKVLSPLR